MQRREFLTLAGAAAAFPRLALAQQAKVRRVALVFNGTDPVTEFNENSSTPFVAALFQELARLGFVEGRTVIFERYSTTTASAQQDASTIVASGPDMIFIGGAATTTRAVMALTNTIPIVAQLGDPLAQGIVSNLARPGGNVTAVAGTASPDSEAKILALLAEAVPTAKRVAYIGVGVGGQFNLAQQGYVQAATDAAPKLGLSMTTIAAREPATERAFRDAFELAMTAKVDMIQFGRHSANNDFAAFTARLALETGMPAISPFEAFSRAGGLLSYGSNVVDNYRKAAADIALILNGAKPGDLPVLQPTLFELIVNLRTARALGLTIPTSLQVQATEVIE